MNKQNKLATGIALAAALFAGQSMAATQGSMGLNSTGSTDITLAIASRVQITSVEDIALGSWAGGGDLVGTSEFCVYRSEGGDYRLTLTANTGAFKADSVLAGASIPFTAKVDDDLDASNGEALTYNTVTAVALTGSNSLTCGGSDNAELEVTFAESDLQTAATANDYKATVTIYVEPI